ncbi:hypothetical protein Ga0466249_000791 [Sporomusaceae bacterium BoRhaA]|nr:hypothetical protein [Pelorhabdus rhamnosifermentans]
MKCRIGQWKASDPKKPGTYQISVDYLKFGNWAIDSTFWKIVLLVPGGNGIGGDDAKALDWILITLL